MKNPRCTVKDQDEGYGCGTPQDHEGYVHAEDITEVEFALEDEREGDGGMVYDCDGDEVVSVDPPNAKDVLSYTFGSQGSVSHCHINFILIPEIDAASPEEVAAAIESIRSTTI